MPGFHFESHPHPSESLKDVISAAKVSATVSEVEDRTDLHAVPSFAAPSALSPAKSVLYLPPLLSSLPPSFPITPVPVKNPPLITTTHLPDIDPASLSLHRALHHFRALDDDYANTSYAEAFNWDELELPVDDEREWYVVAFRSKRKEGSSGESLYEADRLAHAEAIRNGGIILYWYGVPNPTTGMNLATCIWQSRKHAVVANSQPHHLKAVRLAAAAYEVYALERHVLRKVKGETGVTIEPFNGGDVGW